VNVRWLQDLRWVLKVSCGAIFVVGGFGRFARWFLLHGLQHGGGECWTIELSWWAMVFIGGCAVVFIGGCAEKMKMTKDSTKFLIKQKLFWIYGFSSHRPEAEKPPLWLRFIYKWGIKARLWPRVITEAKRHPLLASAQYALVLKPRQNDENNRGKKPLLYWCLPPYFTSSIFFQ